MNDPWQSDVQAAMQALSLMRIRLQKYERLYREPQPVADFAGGVVDEVLRQAMNRFAAPQAHASAYSHPYRGEAPPTPDPVEEPIQAPPPERSEDVASLLLALPEGTTHFMIGSDRVTLVRIQERPGSCNGADVFEWYGATPPSGEWGAYTEEIQHRCVPVEMITDKLLDTVRFCIKHAATYAMTQLLAALASAGSLTDAITLGAYGRGGTALYLTRVIDNKQFQYAVQCLPERSLFSIKRTRNGVDAIDCVESEFELVDIDPIVRYMVGPVELKADGNLNPLFPHRVQPKK